MKKNLQTPFLQRQYMISRDFELYYYSSPNPGSVDSHSHDYYEFYFFLEGDVSMEINGTSIPLSYGDMLLLPPGTSHHLQVNDSSIPYRRFVFWLRPEFYNDWIRQLPDCGYLLQLVYTKKQYLFPNDPVTFSSIQSRLLLLLEELHGQRFCRDAQIFVSVNDLLIHLNRLIHQRENSGSHFELTDHLEQLCRFIDLHLGEDLSLERLSREFYLSKYYLSHLFKDQMGLSIHQYITKKRLAACREAILGGMKITQA